MEVLHEMDLHSHEFKVYIHTSPEGKKYVGITARSPVSRWGNTGAGYMDNPPFWKDICRFGWNNFSHDIVAENLDCESACRMEVDLISRYNTMDPQYGYNRCSGGQWATPNEATREKLRQSLRNRSPKVGVKISKALKGHPVSEETRRKISQAKRGKSVNLGCKRSEAYKKHLSEIMSGRPSWNKGLNKYNNPIIRDYSMRLKGRQFSDQHRRKLRESAIIRNSEGPTMLWMNDGDKEYWVPQTSMQDNIAKGWNLGRLPGMVYIYRGTESKKIPHGDLDEWIKNGWAPGRPPETMERVKRSRQQYWWILDGKLKFSSAKLLAQHLQDQEHLSIVDSTITSLYSKGFGTSPIYNFLDGRISRRPVDKQ